MPFQDQNSGYVELAELSWLADPNVIGRYDHVMMKAISGLIQHVNVNSVHLFPSESCTCPVSTTCCQPVTSLQQNIP